MKRLALLFALAFAAPSPAVQVTLPSGTKAEVFSRGELVDTLALLQLLGVKVGFSAASGSYVASAGSHEVHFTPGGSLAVVDGELVSLPGPVRQLEGRVVAGVETVKALLAPLGFRLVGGASGITVQLASELPVLEASLQVAGDGATVLLAGLGEKPRLVQEKGGFRLVFSRTVQLASVPAGEGVLAGVNVQEKELQFLLAPGWQVAGSEYQEGLGRLTVRLARQAPAPGPSARSAGVLVVLDPGHGGEDEGAKGPSGVLEKHLTLAIARQVAAELQKAGVVVRLTREGDEGVGLADRVALANRLQADCFVSIHANAAPARGARGAETYFMSAEASDREAAQAAERENAAPGAVQLILWELAHVANLEASSRLALELQTRLNQLSGIRDRGVKQAPFAVLTGATMPAVLVEVGFLSNPEEEQRLASPAEQGRLATTLAEGILAFLRSRAAATPTP
jgi:N-acetylmuramoyl-L-alanine amidase